MKYLPLSSKDRAEMLDKIGVETIDDLFASIPEHLRLTKELNVPEAHCEMDILDSFNRMANENTSFQHSFIGAGAYAHFIPTIIDHLTLRQEFFTAYTPYQPEVSQGTLQALFEFQTMMTDLTGMEVSNASVYDGATAAAEAILMASRIQKKRNRVLVSGALHPHYLDVIHTYTDRLDIDVQILEPAGNQTDLKKLEDALDKDVIAVVSGYPNFFGEIEPLETIAELAHQHKALCISVTQEAVSLALLKSPGACGVDIAVGEAQSLGVPLQFGGPYCGFFTCLDKFKRQMPGKICGQTVDSDGKRAFVLTLSAREQHIRRAKATSNICTNQGLMALRVTIFMATLGKNGMRELAQQNLSKAEYLKKKLGSIAGVSISQAPTFNEFVVDLPLPADKVVEKLENAGIQPGLMLNHFFDGRSQQLLVNVTEMHRKEALDLFARELEAAL